MADGTRAFVHSTHLADGYSCRLWPNQRVSFQLQTRPQGLTAVNVRNTDGSPMPLMSHAEWTRVLQDRYGELQMKEKEINKDKHRDDDRRANYRGARRARSRYRRKSKRRGHRSRSRSLSPSHHSDGKSFGRSRSRSPSPSNSQRAKSSPVKHE